MRTSRTSGSAKFQARSAAPAREPAAPLACTAPLWRGFFLPGEGRRLRPFARTAHCSSARFLLKRRQAADRCQPRSPPELAAAIVDCIEAGARVINLSVALVQSSPNGDRALEGALNLAARRGAIVVAATGNHGTVGGSAVTTHACVIPVVACDLRGRAIGYSNLGTSIGRRGPGVPGDEITSLKAGGGLSMLSGTSAAAPFVTGAIALLWSQFPNATAAQVRYAVMQPSKPRRKTIVPPVLDALAAQQALSSWSN